MKKEIIRNIIEQVIEPFTCRILSYEDIARLENDLGVMLEDYEIKKN